MDPKKTLEIPKDGFEGLKQNWRSDALSGFLVFLIALPLCLGIAKASGFPPITGLFTAIMGGTIVSIFMGSQLTIKGPAAGLIVIASGAVEGLTKASGSESTGYHLALAAIVVAAIIQVIFGLLKFGSLSDFFPASAVHAMLAAIGLIIIAKQLHLALGVAPDTLKGMSPFALYALIPHSLLHMNKTIAIVGGTSLLILFGLPMIKNKTIKKFPPALVVLVVSIALGIVLDFKSLPAEFKALVKLDKLVDSITFPDFTAATNYTGIFLKFVLMFALVGSIESLLTVKAIDILDLYKRKSDYNKDLIAIGIGNTFAGLVGGLPMISEVARSSANVMNGGKTRWANFFHGVFLLIFVVIASPLIQMIPNAALSAMLIFVGYRLVSPKEFIHTYNIGVEQMIIFLGTIIMTLATDLLIGIGTGIVLKFIIHLINGVPIASFFSKSLKIENTDNSNKYLVTIRNAAIFSNYIGIRNELLRIPQKMEVILDLFETKLVDHTVIKSLHHFAEDYNHNDGNFKIVGLEEHVALSDHPHAARKKIHNTNNGRLKKSGIKIIQI